MLGHVVWPYTLQFLALFISREKVRQYMIFLQDLRDLQEMPEMKKMMDCNSFFTILKLSDIDY